MGTVKYRNTNQCQQPQPDKNQQTKKECREANPYNVTFAAKLVHERGRARAIPERVEVTK